MFNFVDPTSLTPSFTPSEETPYTNLINTTFTNGPISINFAYAANTPPTCYYLEPGNCYLSFRRGNQMTISATNGSRITEIKFTGNVVQLKCDTYPLCYASGVWRATSDVSTDQVQFSNPNNESLIYSISVKYSRPATPLTLTSSTPAAGSTVEDMFKTMVLNFNTGVEFNNNSLQATLTGPGITTPQAMTATVAGSSATLSLKDSVTTVGDYTVKVPAGLFRNSEYATNDALSISFKVKKNSATLTYVSVDPDTIAEEPYDALPNPVKIKFSKPVKINKEITGVIQHNGEDFMAMNLSVASDDAQTVEVTTGVITTPGTYKFIFPAGIIHSTFFGTNMSDADTWNPAFDITYIVEDTTPPDPVEALKKAAKTLLDNSDKGLVGYPTTESTAYQQLLQLTAAESTTTEEELNNAIVNLYNESSIIMPKKDEWYKVAGVNSEGKKLYLTLSDDLKRIVLGSDSDAATAFKVNDVSYNELVLETSDGRFLHVPSALPNYGITSTGTNLTDEKGEVNTLTFEKFLASDVTESAVAPEALFGKMTLKGQLDKNEDDETTPTVYARFTYSDDGRISTTAANVALVFNSTRSNAFILEKTTEPEGQKVVIPRAHFTPSVLAQSGDNLVLVVTGPSKTTLVNPSQVFWAIKGEKVEFDKVILTATDKVNEFKVNTSGLVKGTYQLVMPEETFEFVAEQGTRVVNRDLVVDLTIQSDGSGTILPQATLSATVIEAGDDLTLKFSNVKQAYLISDGFYQVENEGEWEPYEYKNKILSTKSALEFRINTSNLKIGHYRLYIPAYTFTFVPQLEGQQVENVDITLELTVKEPGQSDDSFQENYNDYIVIFPAEKKRSSVIYADVDLNELILFVYSYMHPARYINGKVYNGLVANPDQQVLVRNTLTGGVAMTGHFENYDNFIHDYGTDYVGTYAIKFVPDTPLKAGDLTNSPGIYGYYCPVGTFGDANYGGWMEGGQVNPEECHVNSKGIIISYTIDNSLVTGINNVSSPEESQPIFDLQGRRVQNIDKKGIYVVNGRKVVKK